MEYFKIMDLRHLIVAFNGKQRMAIIKKFSQYLYFRYTTIIIIIIIRRSDNYTL